MATDSLEQTRLRENNPYSIGHLFLFEEGDFLLFREIPVFSKSRNDRYYTVEESDDLWAIADKAYGDSKWWWVIRDSNDIEFGFDLSIGKTLLIPDLEKAKIDLL